MPRNDLISIRKGNSSDWSGVNPILDSGEPGFDPSNNFLKIGHSGLTWNSLPVVGSHLPTLNVDGYIQFDTTPGAIAGEGSVYWSDGEGMLQMGLKGGNTTISLGEDLATLVYNAEATTLNKGEVVYAFGAQGQRVSVKRASNTGDTTSSKTFGIVSESIASGSEGWVINRGEIRDINTNAFNEGDLLWLGSTPGTFTSTKQYAPNHLVFIGIVIKKNASSGRIYVAPQNGYELDELHNVSISGVSDGQFLQYNSASGLWLASSSGNFNYLAVNGVPVSTGTGGGGGGTNITNPGTNRVLLSDGTANGIVAQSGLTFNGSTLFINGVNSRNGQNLYMWANFR